MVPQPTGSCKSFDFCTTPSVIFLLEPSTGAPSVRPVFAREHESLNHWRHKGVTLCQNSSQLSSMVLGEHQAKAGIAGNPGSCCSRLFASLRPGSPLGGFAATGHFFFVFRDRLTFDAAGFEAVPAGCRSDGDVAFACLSRSSNELGGYPEVSIPLKIS